MLRKRTRVPAGFVSPCLPSAAKAPPLGPGWLHEIKHDGFRIIARRDGSSVRLFSRPGNDLTHRFPMTAAAIAALSASGCVIDGEAMVTDAKGLAIFDHLRRRSHHEVAILCAFDLIELDGEDL